MKLMINRAFFITTILSVALIPVLAAAATNASIQQNDGEFPPLRSSDVIGGSHSPAKFQEYINPFSTPNSPKNNDTRFAIQNNEVPQTSMAPMNSNMNGMLPKNNPFTNPQGMTNNNYAGTNAQQLPFPGAPKGFNQQTNNGFVNPSQLFNNSNKNNSFPGNFMPNMGGKNGTPFSLSEMNNSFPFMDPTNANPMNGWNNSWTDMGKNFPFMPKETNTERKKAWGTERNIWPDFYTDFTDSSWDEMIGAPRSLGRMPGGWRFPYLSTPDPVTVSDAITNQFPPIVDEAGNMGDFTNWGMFDNK